MKNYTLYLDESETHQHNRVTHIDSNYHFCMAGIIIADDDYSNLENDVINLKQNIWSDLSNSQNIILHQMRISEAAKGRLDVIQYPEYMRFRAHRIQRNFYRELKLIFTHQNLTIVGGSICKDDLRNNFSIGNKNVTDNYLISLQLLLENYCHFLCANNGLGKIIYESREPIGDENLRNRFYHIKLMGSMYMPQKTMEKHLLGIDFIEKGANNAGLQIADFVPNSFAKDHASFTQDTPNIFSTLKYCRYDGNVDNKNRFGVKYMP